jgi:catechol 2,3-dioxygenase
MSLPPDTHIAYVRLVVRDMKRALAFYHDALGLRLLSGNTQQSLLAADSAGSLLIELIANADAIPQPRRSAGLYHVAIRLPNRAALARTVYRLVSLGVRFQGASDHQVSEAVYLADPDGNGLELYRDRPRGEWRMDGAQVTMGSDPLDTEALLREGAHDYGAWTGIDPATDIGHVHLHVSNLARAEAFYCGALGFDVMQRNYPGALFVAAGGYHHHLGLNTWAGEGVPPPPDNAVGLRAFGIRIPDAGGWSAALERLRAGGATVEMGDDQKTAHVRSSDEMRIEITHS